MAAEIFSNNPDINKNAYLNWRTDPNDQSNNLRVLASDFADGAIALINCILADNSDKKADALIMPILYCIDQSIEVYLKAIIGELEELSGNKIGKRNDHDIRQLKNTMVSLIKKKERITKGLEKHLQPVSSYIDELYNKIQVKTPDGHTELNIDFARYPFSLNGIPHFYILATDNVVIDIENLGQRFYEIRDSLESLYWQYCEEKEMIRNI